MPVELSSATEAEIEANPQLNLIAVVYPDGTAEYVQFTTAVAVPADPPYRSKYLVSGFLRGRFGTEWAAMNAGPQNGEHEVVVMDSAVKPILMSIDDIGAVRQFKAVTSGQSVDDAMPFSLTYRCDSMRAQMVSDVTVGTDASNDWLIQFVGHAKRSEEPAEYAVEVWSDATRDNPANRKRTLPVTSGTTHACLLDSSGNWVVSDDLASELITSFHADRNNLNQAPASIASAQTIETLDATFTQFSLTFHTATLTGAANTLIISAGIANEALATSGFSPVAADCPIYIEWRCNAGATDMVETIKNFGSTIGTPRNLSAASGKDIRYTILLSGTEYRVYENYSPSAGNVPLAIAATPSTGFPFPLRLRMSLVDGGTQDAGIRNVVAGGNVGLRTVYAARDWASDFPSMPPTMYLRLYQKGRSPIPDGWPLDVAVQTRGGLLLLESGSPDNLLTEASDNLVKE